MESSSVLFTYLLGLVGLFRDKRVKKTLFGFVAASCYVVISTFIV